VSLKNSGFLYVVDENENICATIEVPKETFGPEDDNFFTFRAVFTPTTGAHQYGLRVYIENTGSIAGWDTWAAIIEVMEATIVLHQTDLTKTGIHIPMLTDVNASEMQWSDFMSRFGQHVVSNGFESLCTELKKIADYPDCEEADNVLDSQKRTIWKFEEAELKNVSKVVFDAGVGFNSPSVSPSSKMLTGTPDFSWCRAQLRWCPVNVGTSPANLSGTYLDATVVDGSARVFTYVEGSDFTWSRSVDGAPISQRCYLDIASLTAGDGGYLYVASNENVYGGENGSGSYHHWGRLRTFTIPSGRVITSAWIDYYVWYNPATTRDEFNITFNYTLDNAINIASIVLYDITADANVAGSEMVWSVWTPWERKSVTLDPSVLISGHEYKARWKSGTGISSWTADPMVSDINLYVYVTNVEAFTSWKRVTKNWTPNTLFDWIDPTWGVRLPSADSEDPGTIDIMARTKLFKPDNAEIYYEVTATKFTGLNTDGYDPSLYRSSLWDCGVDDNAIGTTKSEEIEESAIVWVAPGDGMSHRQRTGDIAQYLTDQNRYVDMQPGADTERDYWPLSGFIVTKFNIE